MLEEIIKVFFPLFEKFRTHIILQMFPCCVLTEYSSIPGRTTNFHIRKKIIFCWEPWEPLLTMLGEFWNMQGLSEGKIWRKFKFVMKSWWPRMVGQIHEGWFHHCSLINPCNLQTRGPRTTGCCELIGCAKRRRNYVLSSLLSPDRFVIDQLWDKIWV